MNPSDFRKQWSHKPTPIPQNASGLWYSEECVDELLSAFASQVREQSIAELVGEWVSVASPDAPESLPPIAHKVAAKLIKQVELGGKHVKSIVAAYLVAYAEKWHPKERKTQ